MTLNVVARLIVACFVANLVAIGAVSAQTSYVSVSKTESSSSCSFSAPPDESFWTYVDFKIEHKIQCPSSVVTLETQYMYGSYQSGCPAYGYSVPACVGFGNAPVYDNGSHWNVETLYQNKYRIYTFGDYECQSSSVFGGGGLSFAKVEASQVCP